MSLFLSVYYIAVIDIVNRPYLDTIFNDLRYPQCCKPCIHSNTIIGLWTLPRLRELVPRD